MDFDVPVFSAEDIDGNGLVHGRFLMGAVADRSQFSPPKWIVSIWDHKHAIEPAMLRVPLVILSFAVLWAINIYGLEKANVPFNSVLSVKSINSVFIFITALGALGIYGCIVMLANVSHSELELSMIWFYMLVLVAMLLPSLPGLDYRNHFGKLFRNVVLPMPNSSYLINTANGTGSSSNSPLTHEYRGLADDSMLKDLDNIPSAVVPFVEILLADGLCSISKVLKDLGTTVIALYAFTMDTHITDYHYVGMFVVALMASLPFIIRVRQCSIQWYYSNDSHARVLISINIIKYITSFPPIWITAAVTLGFCNSIDTIQIAIAAATINSLLSFMWDIVMDWGLFSVSLWTGKCTYRSRTYYHTLFYVFAVVSNFILRFAWAINRISYFKTMSSSQLILIIEFMEIFRRFIWNFLRIEWEVINSKSKLAQIVQSQGTEKL